MLDELLGMVIAVGYTFISTIVVVLIVINVLVGIIGGIWLAVRGEWGLIAWGIALAFIMPWAWMLVNLPSMGLFFLVNRFMDKGNRVLVAIFCFLSSTYTYMLIVLWVFCAFGFFMRHASSEMYVPYLLWGYSSMMAPLAYMAKKEGQESAGTSAGLFCAQLSFVIVTLFWFFGVFGIALFVTFSCIVLAFSLFAVFLVVSSMSDHYEDRNYVLKNQPEKKIPSYLPWSILLTFWCIPLGIVSIVYSSMVIAHKKSGNYLEAERASKKARMWCWITFAVTFAVGLVSAYFISRY
jgi:hypothetical protein